MQVISQFRVAHFNVDYIATKTFIPLNLLHLRQPCHCRFQVWTSHKKCLQNVLNQCCVSTSYLNNPIHSPACITNTMGWIGLYYRTQDEWSQGSHTFVSSDPESNSDPSEFQAKALTHPWWPWNVAKCIMWNAGIQGIFSTQQ